MPPPAGTESLVGVWGSFAEGVFAAGEGILCSAELRPSHAVLTQPLRLTLSLTHKMKLRSLPERAEVALRGGRADRWRWKHELE